MIQHWFDYTAPQFPGSAYIPAVFGTIVYFYGGSPFLRGGYHELRNRLPGMMTLISLAITVAFLYSALVTLGVVEGLDLWWELATRSEEHTSELQSLMRISYAVFCLKKIKIK